MKLLKINKNGKGLLIVFLVLGLLIFGLNKQSELSCQSINVEILNQYDNYFLNKSEIIRLITKNGKRTILDQKARNLNLLALEQEIKANKFVKSAEVFIGYDGVLNVKAIQRRPIARVVRDKLPDAYIDKEGFVLPVSDQFTARVPIISGVFSDKIINNGLNTKGFSEQLLFLLNLINQDEFLGSMIVHLIISEEGRVNLLTQIGKQILEFGNLSKIEDKLDKIKIVYKKILPLKGWNDYSRINLEFEGQIICE